MIPPKVLLIGWDAADWKVILPLIDRGEMPHLARFLESGVMGDITTLEPILSPMLWNSIGTGKFADQHGILGFTEVDPDTGRVRPVTSTSRRCKAIWNILSQNGYRTHVINWFGGHPAEPIRGVCVSDAYGRQPPPAGKPWKMMPGTVHPPELAETLAEFRVRPSEIDAAALALFVPRAGEVDQETDKHLATLAKLLAEAYTVHACATYVLQKHPWDFMGIYYPTIDHFSHAFMNYHPPRMDWVDEKQFELYHDVLNGGYRLHDLMLGAMMAMIPPETTVIICSDHGFHSDHLRPQAIPAVPAGPAAQHRPLGIFAMRGPGVRRDERIYGARLLDVAPTILNLFGLPAGKDMPGRPLLEAFDEPRRVERIESWERMEGEAGMHRGPMPMDAQDADALIDQFVALGYIDKPEADREEAARNCIREQKWNLARVFQTTQRPQLALPLLEEITGEAPQRADYLQELSRCQAMLGMTELARASLLAAIEKAPSESPGVLAALASLDLAEGKQEEAIARLERAAAIEPNSPSTPIQIGAIYLRARRAEEAERQFQRAIGIDPHNDRALELLARTYLRLNRWEDAAVAALDAVGFRHDLPLSHLYLGIALLKLGRLDRAMQAFETCLSFQPPLRAAHIWLARTLLRIPGRQLDAIEQRDRARQARLRFTEVRDRMRHAREEGVRQAEARAAERADRNRAASEQKAAETAAALADGRISQAQAEQRPLEFIVVSGLPRSGTSLMMQMLEAGGLPAMTDGERIADTDNPRGYLEWEAIKQIRKEPDLLYRAEGKAIKVISMLLASLPRHHRYKVIFMNRPIEEVASSQRKMLERRNAKGAGLSEQAIAKQLEAHRKAVLGAMQREAHFELLVVDYPDLVREPDSWIAKVTEFVGAGRLPAADHMRNAVDPALHRNRTFQVERV